MVVEPTEKDKQFLQTIVTLTHKKQGHRMQCRAHLRGAVRGMIPTKGEGATDQLPMSPDRFVTPNLILRPAQSVFDLLVALLDPLAQPIEPDHFFQASRREAQHS